MTIADGSPQMLRIPTYLDRYPAKMVSHLAAKLCKRFVGTGEHVLDPFCGSGAVLSAALTCAERVTGLDVNPYAVLLAEAKLRGFSVNKSRALLIKVSDNARRSRLMLPATMNNQTYWFTPRTLEKYGRLRYWSKELSLSSTREGRAVLLALALTARRCSRADQRSPKPFISKTARRDRCGRHFDPIDDLAFVFGGISEVYGGRRNTGASVKLCDVVLQGVPARLADSFSAVITSPPYLNAQDYYRNFKLELSLLEGLLPFSMELLRDQFVGTERGDLGARVSNSIREWNLAHIESLGVLERTHPHQAAVIHRYFADMHSALRSFRLSLRTGGKLILVCGDNLIGGIRIPTWDLLERLAQDIGYSFVARFGDQIARRNVPPKRLGHRGLIKEEIISELVAE
jgi:SAM-dependent methyltransferase